MVLTFKSSIPESFTLTGTDPDGRQRVCTATKNPGDFNWQINLRHPSGENWDATYHVRGNAGVIDAMAELMRSKDQAFKSDRTRGDRPPQAPYDGSRSIDGFIAPVTAIRTR